MAGVSVALSGGGHRASLFGLGVLLYLADAGKNRDVGSIASVSGGSITNGFTGQQLDYASCTKGEFESKAAAPLAGQIAQRGTLFAPRATKLYLVLLVLSAAATLLGPWQLAISVAERLAAFAAGVWWTSWLFGQRGNVCGAAYRKTLFSPDGCITRLADLSERSVWHILCATDLRQGRQVYLAPKFVYGYSLGFAAPEDLGVYKAVQASAAFPGGFPPTRISTRGLSFRDTRSGQPRNTQVGELVLADGGVYDNMGDQWARGLIDRLQRWRWLAEQLPDKPDTLIVVNSSAPHDWTPPKVHIPVWGELAALLRDTDVLYQNTTAVRRQDLVERFDEAERQQAGLRGALVMIEQSPFKVASFFARNSQRPLWPQRAARADRVLELLAGEGRESWEQIAKENSNVPTTLSALGTKISARLMRHAYVLAMCNLHVVLDYPLLPLPPASRFDNLAQGQVTSA